MKSNSSHEILLTGLGSSLEIGLHISGISIAINLLLAVSKIATGIIGNSYALIADGIESTTDIVSSLIVWSGFKISAKPPDANHPYGHGKAESIAGVLVSLFLLGAGLLIATQSIREIFTPQHLPAWYTLLVLGVVIAIKESLYRFVYNVGNSIRSSSLKSDAWHHRSDALTSAAAFIGISIALVGGKGYESADDWAALLACCVIFYNAFRMFRSTVNEVMDGAVPTDVEKAVRGIASKVKGVVDVEKCRIRKSGLGLLMDIHVTVDGNISVREGHSMAHKVKDHLLHSELAIQDVVVHIEPHGM